MRKIITISGLIKRDFGRKQRLLTSFCEQHNIPVFGIDSAHAYSICVLSINEYMIGEYAKYCDENCQGLFVNECDYDECEAYLSTL